MTAEQIQLKEMILSIKQLQKDIKVESDNLKCLKDSLKKIEADFLELSLIELSK